MVFTTVTLLIHGYEDTWQISDYVDDDGKFVNNGVQAANAIEKRQAIHYVMDDEGVDSEEFIPFHSIVAANITKSEGEYTKPDDIFCQPVCEEKKSYTVTWMNGEESLGTEIYPEGATPSYKGETPTGEGEFLGWNTDSSAATALETLPAVESATTFYAIFGEGDK